MGVDNKIRLLRAQKNLTQDELAHRVGVTRQTIIAIEKGKYVPSLELALKIAKEFKLEIEQIFKISE